MVAGARVAGFSISETSKPNTPNLEVGRTTSAENHTGFHSSQPITGTKLDSFGCKNTIRWFWSKCGFGQSDANDGAGHC